MLIDQLLVFSDDVAARTDGVSDVVEAMPFLGKGNEVTVSVCVTEAYPEGAHVALTVQDSTDGTTFTDRGAVSFPAEVLRRGGVFSFSLPKTVVGPKIRLAYAVTGAPATGKLWAGVTRDSLEAIEQGQYVK